MMMAFPQLASIGTVVSLLGCCASLGAQSAKPAPTESANSWQAAATLTEGINTNVLMSFQNPKADATSLLQLDLGRRWSGPHWSFQATYTPQAVNYERNRGLDYISHSYTQAWQAALSPRIRLGWTLSYDHYPERAGAPSAGGGLAAVTGASQAMAVQSILAGVNSNFSLSDQYSLRGSWTAGASVTVQRFSPDIRLLRALPGNTPVPPVTDTRSGGGNLGWSWKLTPERSLEISATDNELWFTNPAQRMRYADVQANLIQQFGPDIALQAGIGPAWNQILKTVTTAQQLPGQSYAANASLTTQQGGTVYGISWQHTEQAGLVPGGVATDNVALDYGVGWGRGFHAQGSIGEGHFTGLGADTVGTTRPASQDSLFVSGQFDWRLGSAWSLSAQTVWSAQGLPVSLTTVGELRRLQASVGITYAPVGAH
ncbi:MAG TPA: hypothetical protein VN690_06460 [Terriglobales bacterium]|nr:hypothetical protein [Terriglobales bacterium]